MGAHPSHSDRARGWEFVGWWMFFLAVFGIPWWTGVMVLILKAHEFFAR